MPDTNRIHAAGCRCRITSPYFLREAIECLRHFPESHMKTHSTNWHLYYSSWSSCPLRVFEVESTTHYNPNSTTAIIPTPMPSPFPTQLSPGRRSNYTINMLTSPTAGDWSGGSRLERSYSLYQRWRQKLAGCNANSSPGRCSTSGTHCHTLFQYQRRRWVTFTSQSPQPFLHRPNGSGTQ